MPDSALLAARGASWVYAITPSPNPLSIDYRPPRTGEEAVVESARRLLNERAIKALVLLDGPSVVYAGFKPPASETSIFYGASVAKTFTAMAVGRAICAGKLRLDEPAAGRIPALAGKPLGRATVGDLLRMASGATPPLSGGNPFTGNIWTDEETKLWSNGVLDLIQSVSSDRIASAERGVFSDFRPGEHFVYKNTDPLVLGLMVEAAAGMPYAEWFQTQIQ